MVSKGDLNLDKILKVIKETKVKNH